MAVSKVVLGNQTVMDITDSTVDAGSLLAGKKAYGANGEAVNGSLVVSDRIRWNEAKTSVKKNFIKKSTLDYIKSINIVGTWSGNTFVKNGITWTVNDDGTISATGTASSDSFLYLSGQNNIAFSLESGDYIITGCPSEGSTSKYRVEYTFFASDESNIYSRDIGEPVQVTLPQEREAQVICYISNGYAISESLVFKPMIRLASIKDDTYVPYIPDNVELKTLADTKANKSGDTFTGQIKTSFRQSVATGAIQSAANTVSDLCDELRYSSGCMGSVQLTSDYTKNGVIIKSGWYNYLWIPHRSGGVNGAASGDNTNFGTLILTMMTGNDGINTPKYIIRFSAGSICELIHLCPMYFDQTATTSTTDPTTYTFTDARITANSVIDVYTDIFGVYPSSVVASAGTCTVTFPKQDTAQSMTCRIYIK